MTTKGPRYLERVGCSPGEGVTARAGAFQGAFLRSFCCLVLLLLVSPGMAHEFRPAYLELREERPGEFSVLWKTPMLDDARLALEPEFSGDAQAITPITMRTPPGAAVQTWTLRAPALGGQTLRIRGLESTMTDALVRLQYLDGRTQVARLVPSATSFVVEAAPSRWRVAATYLRLGTDHILTGVDHLLFVLGLMLIVKGRWRLLKTITAFTVAHSITLAIATLGYAAVPPLPLNAAIALSILFLGPEIVRSWRGETSFTIRHPWVVAFAFGLLHGFGFATALVSAGLPRAELPLALVSFNVGVEIGQLAFIGIIIALTHAFRVLRISWPRWAQLLPGYTVGALGAFWTVQRLVSMFGGFR